MGHGPGKTSTLHAFDPSGPPVMTAAISMDDGALFLWQNSNRMIQHGIDQSGIGAAADCPVHNQTIETVNERREIELTLRKSEFRDICQPFFIWVIRMEIRGGDADKKLDSKRKEFIRDVHKRAGSVCFGRV